MTTDTDHVPRSVAITGAGSGLGKEIAVGFADKGYRVFGTARTPDEVEDVRPHVVVLARADLRPPVPPPLPPQTPSWLFGRTRGRQHPPAHAAILCVAGRTPEENLRRSNEAPAPAGRAAGGQDRGRARPAGSGMPETAAAETTRSQSHRPSGRDAGFLDLSARVLARNPRDDDGS
jgi:NAD(P)-dependent dehydrogenase (short-subunit alcohol dehydrogenase family)